MTMRYINRHYLSILSIYPSVHLFIHYQFCEHDILKTNELVLPQIGTSDPQGKRMKRSTFCG